MGLTSILYTFHTTCSEDSPSPIIPRDKPGHSQYIQHWRAFKYHKTLLIVYKNKTNKCIVFQTINNINTCLHPSPDLRSCDNQTLALAFKINITKYNISKCNVTDNKYLLFYALRQFKCNNGVTFIISKQKT